MTKKTKETNNKESLLEKVFPKRIASKKPEKKSTTSKKDEKISTKKNTAPTKKTTAKKKDVLPQSSAKEKSTPLKETALTNKPVSEQAKTALKKDNYSNLIKANFSPEYYDLPYRYNQTVVKILAQTPTNLFIYWDISDEDRENFKKQYGEYFFEITKPVLVVHNKTMNYSFEIDINDFANSWYLTVNDSNCEYKIELGRRPIPINYSYIPQYDAEKNGPISPIETPYIYISSSNEIESPNDKILFNKQDKIYFRNVKTNEVYEKDIKEFPFINKDNEFISIYELYKNLYKEEISNSTLDLNNPSSGNPSSGNFSS